MRDIDQRRATILTYVHVVFLIVGFVGMMLLWSDANIDGLGQVTIFFNLVLSMLLYTISIGASDFIPGRWTSGMRMVALFFLFVFAQSAVCRIDYYMNLEGGTASDETHRNTVRTGSIMVVVCALSIFLVNHCVPHHTPAIPHGFVSIRHIAAIVVALAALASQIIIYFIKDGCYVNVPHKFTVILAPGIFAIVTFTSHLYEDCAMQDFTFMIAIFWLLAAAPLFGDYEHPNQDNYPELWRASVGLLFGAAVLYVVATLVHAVIYRKQADTREEKKKSHRMLAIIVQAALLLVTLGGAITVYIRVADDVVDTWPRTLMLYLVTGLVLCPIANLIREITDIEAFHIVAFALAFHLLGAVFVFLHDAAFYQTGYIRGGIVFEVTAVIISMIWVPFVRAKERSIAYLFEGHAVWGAFLFGVWGIATAYTWGAATPVPIGVQVAYIVWPIVLLIWLMHVLARGRIDEERVMFFIALHIGLSGYVWLINEVQKQTFDYATLFVATVMLVMYYLIVGPGCEPFAFIHHLHTVKPVTPGGRHEPADTQPRHVEPYEPAPAAHPEAHPAHPAIASAEHHA